MEFNEKIKEILEKQLSQEASGLLREALEDYEKVKADLKAARKSLESKDGMVQELQGEVNELREFKDLTGGIERREVDLGKRESEMEIEKRKLEVESEFNAKQVAFMEKTMDSLLGNRRIREKIQDSVVLNGGEVSVGSYDNPVMQKCHDSIEGVEKMTEREES